MNKQQIIQNLVPILEAYIADEELLQPQGITRLSLPIAWLTIDHLTTYLNQHPGWVKEATEGMGTAYSHTTSHGIGLIDTTYTILIPPQTAVHQAIHLETAVNAIARAHNAHPYQVIIDLYKSLLPPSPAIPTLKSEVAIDTVLDDGFIEFFATPDALADFDQFGTIEPDDEKHKYTLWPDGRFDFSEVLAYMQSYSQQNPTPPPAYSGEST